MHSTPKKTGVTSSIADDGAIVIRVEGARAGAADDLVALDACGLELAAVRRLARDGRLRVARIGRRKYVRRSELLACFDALAAEQAAKPAPKGDDYGALVALAGGRRR